MRIAPYWKAVVAAIVAGGGSLGTGLQDGVLTVPEIIAVVLATCAGAGITWAVPNRPATDV